MGRKRGRLDGTAPRGHAPVGDGHADGGDTDNDDVTAQMDEASYWLRTELWNSKPLQKEQAVTVMKGIAAIVEKTTHKPTQETRKVMLKVVQVEMGRCVYSRRHLLHQYAAEFDIVCRVRDDVSRPQVHFRA